MHRTAIPLTPRSLEPIVRRSHTVTLVGAMTLGQLPAYTANRPLCNWRSEQPDTSNYGLSGGAMAVTSTVKSTPRRTLAAHWRCALNHRRPLRCGRDFPSFTVAVQRSVPPRHVAAETWRPRRRSPKFPRIPRRVDRRAATLMRRPADTKRRLTMRLSDAGWRRHKTELIYPDHRLPPWFTENATPRSLEPIVRHKLTLGRALEQ
jgi:hypothetical protein